MTAIVCFNWVMGAVFLADSRLSYAGPSGQTATVRDVCQKLWVPNGWSVLGFSGDLCLANSLAGEFFLALKDKKWTHDNLLEDDAAMRELALSTVATHSESFGEQHDRCVALPAALLFAYVGRIASNNAQGELDHYELATRTVSITSGGEIEHSGLGAAVLGEGAKMIEHALTLERVTEVANAGDPELQVFHALVATSHYVQKYKAKSVGLPLQAVHISPRGVLVVPYFYWVDVTNRFGTYVAMRIENGDWVQEHRPSNTKRRMKRPFELLNQEIDEGQWPLHKAEMFDPRMVLTNLSPGVIRKPNPNLIYTMYDPPNVHEAVVQSWGADPIELLTWANQLDGPAAK